MNTHEILSYSDFISVIEDNTYSYQGNMISLSSFDEIYFDVYVDEQLETVEVDVIFEYTNQRGTKSGTASHDTYNSAGLLLYTVTVNGSFSYSSNSCSTTSATGSFNKPLTSLWSSNPSITKGNISNKKAYARISGTASFLNNTSTYRLTLYCDNTGKLTMSFSRP